MIIILVPCRHGHVGKNTCAITRCNEEKHLRGRAAQTPTFSRRMVEPDSRAVGVDYLAELDHGLQGLGLALNDLLDFGISALSGTSDLLLIGKSRHNKY